jgi:addiction module HigA family antidote
MAATGDKQQHPGRVLQRMFMEPHRLGVNQLARALKVPPNRISAILNGQRSITADTALRFARFFDTTALYWMNLQARYDLAVTEQVLRDEIDASISTLKDHKSNPLDDSPVDDTES